MAAKDDEEDQLRSVALQNAQSIFLARQRAEEDLVRTKRALELKTAELAQSVAMLRATLESTTDGILVTDAGGQITSFNEKFVEMWRLPRAVMDLRQHRRLLEVTRRNFKDPQGFLARIEDIYSASPPETYDLLELEDGRVIERFSRIQSVQGRNVGRVWIFRDITERRRFEEALHKQSEWSRITLLSIGDAVITTDPMGNVTSMNPVAESLTGWTLQDAQGIPLNTVFCIINERTRELVENPAMKVLREGQIVGLANHTILVARDGTEHSIDDSAAPIRDGRGNIIGVVLIFRDITGRRKDEAHLRQSEQELSDFFENATVGLHWVGPDGTILRVNQAELNMLGYAREEYVGRNIAEFHTDEDVISSIMQKLQAGESLQRCEARLRCKDGSHRHVLIDSNVRWQDGRIIHTRCFTRDITQEKLAQQALRESESQLRMVMDHAPVLIARCDKELRYQFVNRSYAERLNLRPEEIVGKHISEVLGPEAFDSIRPYIDLVLSGKPVDYELEVPYRSIGPRFIRCAYEPERNISGEVQGWVAVVNDITERKEANESRALLGAIVASSQDAIVSMTLEGRILSWNTGAERLFGYTPREAIGSPITMVVPPDLQDEEPSILEQISRGELIGNYETVRISKAGRRIDVSLSVSPVLDGTGRVIGASKITRDITVRKRAEQTTRFLADASAALAELTDYETTLLRIANLAVPLFADWCFVDIQDVNGSLRRLAISHGDPAKARLAQELDREYPSLPSDPHGIRNVLRTGQSEWVAVISDTMLAGMAQDERHLSLLRERRMKSYICVPLKSHGKMLGALTFGTAESGREYRIEDLRAAEDLSHRAAIAMENAKLVATLKETDQRKDEFLAMLAHELRNPLAPLLNSVQILRSKSPPVPELHWAREVIERQAQQMTRLVDDLLDVSRVTKGKIELRRNRIELTEVVSSAVEASRPLIEKWGHELIVKIPAEPIHVHADLTRLSQVLLNLLNNAAKYMNQGGKIWLTVERQGADVCIRVKDSGIGIPPDMLSKVFDMFTQLDRSLERSQGGLGIGLTLVKRIVEMHGGTVMARSDGSGMGSEFIVRLPLAGAGEEHQSQSAPSAKKDSEVQKCRILLVDDNRDAADTLGMLLRMLGNEVHTAHDGLEAVGAAAAFQPDIVLLDIGLPKLNGYDAARRIREQHAGRDMVLIALTGWGQEEDRRRSKEAGFDHHLTKPIDFNALQALLADLSARKCGKKKE